jgi:hypothetical protein
MPIFSMQQFLHGHVVDDLIHCNSFSPSVDNFATVDDFAIAAAAVVVLGVQLDTIILLSSTGEFV